MRMILDQDSNLKSLRILLQDGFFAMGKLALEDAQEIVRLGKSLEHLETDKYVILDDFNNIETNVFLR